MHASVLTLGAHAAVHEISHARDPPLRVSRSSHLDPIDPGRGDEPYVSFAASDALVQVGVASVLMLLWLQLALLLVVRIRRRTLSRAWISLVVWALLCEFYLFHCPFGYVDDITRFAIPASRPG